MSAVAKLAATGLGLASIGTGGFFLWQHMNSGMPPWHSLTEDSDYSSQSGSNGEYQGKYGSLYSNYLIGINEASNNKTPKNNDLWWDWSYLNRFKETTGIKGKFKEVKQATGGDTTNLSLKAVCTQAYKETATGENHKIKTSGEPGNDDFREEDIWKFCSPIGQKPTTLDNQKNSEEKKKYKDKLGEDTTNISKFISIDDPGNEIFWQIRQEEFFTENGSFSPPSSGTDDTFFKSFYDSEKVKEKGQRATIKEKCREAYLVNKPAGDSSPASNPTTAKIAKYCSLNGS